MVQGNVHQRGANYFLDNKLEHSRSGSYYLGYCLQVDETVLNSEISGNSKVTFAFLPLVTVINYVLKDVL